MAGFARHREETLPDCDNFQSSMPAFWLVRKSNCFSNTFNPTTHALHQQFQLLSSDAMFTNGVLVYRLSPNELVSSRAVLDEDPMTAVVQNTIG